VKRDAFCCGLGGVRSVGGRLWPFLDAGALGAGGFEAGVFAIVNSDGRVWAGTSRIGRGSSPLQYCRCEYLLLSLATAEERHLFSLEDTSSSECSSPFLTFTFEEEWARHGGILVGYRPSWIIASHCIDCGHLFYASEEGNMLNRARFKNVRTRLN
jgi:hypothetical protein